MRKFRLLLLFLLGAGFLSIGQNVITVVNPQNNSCSNLEPSKPKIFYDYEILRQRDLSYFKEKTFSIREVLTMGKTMKFVTVLNDAKYQRPVYHPNWHSTSPRWSYMPLNLANQRHKIFSYSGGLSEWYDMEHELILPEKAGVPSPIHNSAFTIEYPYVTRLIIFDAEMVSMKYYHNQIAVVVEPRRQGIHVVDFDDKNLPKGQYLIQMVTPDGYELDYFRYYVNH